MSTSLIKLSQACEGMIRYKSATGESDHTISDGGFLCQAPAGICH
jgi:hypothetical protein